MIMNLPLNDKGLTQMTATLSKSYNYLLSFLVVYIIIFLSHSLILSRFFGQTNKEYSTFLLSSFTLIRTLLANLNLQFFNDNNSVLLQLIFFSYFFFVFIILIGIFLAIINESYSLVLEQYEKKPELDYFDFFFQTIRQNPTQNYAKIVSTKKRNERFSR